MRHQRKSKADGGEQLHTCRCVNALVVGRSQQEGVDNNSWLHTYVHLHTGFLKKGRGRVLSGYTAIIVWNAQSQPAVIPVLQELSDWDFLQPWNYWVWCQNASRLLPDCSLYCAASDQHSRPAESMLSHATVTLKLSYWNMLCEGSAF